VNSSRQLVIQLKHLAQTQSALCPIEAAIVTASRCILQTDFEDRVLSQSRLKFLRFGNANFFGVNRQIRMPHQDQRHCLPKIDGTVGFFWKLGIPGKSGQ
jgi:hypothetical protein